MSLSYYERIGRYNQQLEQAGEDFKAATGKKNKRGFKDTPEYKRIARNKRRFISRWQKGKLKERSPKFNAPQYEPVKSDVLAKGSIYHVVLSYNSKVARVVRDEFLNAIDASGPRRVLVEFKFPPDSESMDGVSNTIKGFDTRMRQMYQVGLEGQENSKKGETDYMLVDAVATSSGGDKFFYIKSYFV